MIARLIIRLSLSYFRCLRGKYLDSEGPEEALPASAAAALYWPDQMGMEIGSVLIFFGAV